MRSFDAPSCSGAQSALTMEVTNIVTLDSAMTTIGHKRPKGASKVDGQMRGKINLTWVLTI